MAISKVVPRPASRVPRNGSDASRNARIVFRSIFTPRKDPSFPRNAKTVLRNIHVLRFWRDEHKPYLGSDRTRSRLNLRNLRRSTN
jgi:hypothetical protein